MPFDDYIVQTQGNKLETEETAICCLYIGTDIYIIDDRTLTSMH